MDLRHKMFPQRTAVSNSKYLEKKDQYYSGLYVWDATKKEFIYAESFLSLISSIGQLYIKIKLNA